MSSRKRRFISWLIPFAGVLVLAGVIAPFASAQEFTPSFTVNPTNALKNKVITSQPLVETAAKVKVHVTPPEGFEGSLANITVTLNTVAGDGLHATENISGNEELTDASGDATFPLLKIGETNEPTFTDYQLVAVLSGTPTTTTPPIGVAFASEGAYSDTFDIWDAGCPSPCSASLKNNSQAYRATDGILTLTDVSPDDVPNLECEGYTPIIGEHVFSHATTGTDAVFVTSRISKAEMKAAANNGQVFVRWCVGLKSEQPWIHNGAPHELIDVNGGDAGGNLWVGFAPKCPKTATPSDFAPCIVKQKADPSGGNITTGWLPGGDPPRRT
jgi:hypothetical protein